MTEQQDTQTVTNSGDEPDTMLSKALGFGQVLLTYGEMALNLILDYILWVIIAFVLYKVAIQLRAKIMSYWVQADLN